MIELANNTRDRERIWWKNKNLSRMLYLENNITKGVQMKLIRLQIWNESYKFLEEV